MIFTVTFNPSLDYVVNVPDFKLGKTNRTVEEHLFPGGKGINVSIVLNNLNIENTALGFLAGFTGKEIDGRLMKMGIKTDFIWIEGENSRINLKLQNIEGTEINGMGPHIPAAETEKLLGKLEALNSGDVLILAGSIPASMPDDIYRDILRRLESKGVLTIVDAAKDLLMNVLSYHPFLIKPNNDELGEIFGVVLNTRESVIPYAKKLQEQGARNVLVSMAGKGAVLISEEGQVIMAEAPEGMLINSVGAGDSMVAGFAAGWISERDYEKAFRLGVAAGSASAFSENLATQDEIMELYKRVEIVC